MDTKIYTSEEILGMETEEVCGLFEGNVTYKLTEGEIEWANFVKGNYSIAEHILENANDENIIELDSYEFSKVLDGDNKGAGMAPMLSEDSALQRLFFCGYTETDDDDE
jgi:hypothetical protein